MSEFYSEAEAREIIRQSVVDEKLIEEAAIAIHSVAESGASWFDARMADKAQHRSEARAVLAVFEKALTPTDDKREVDALCGDWPAPCNCDDPETHDGSVPRWLVHEERRIEPHGEPRRLLAQGFSEGVNFIDDQPGPWGAAVVAGRAEAARRVAAAGFRRSEVPEPSTDEVDLPNGHAPVAKLSPFLARRIVDTQEGPTVAQEATAPKGRAGDSGAETQGEPYDASKCGHCGGKAWHHTVECFTGAQPVQEAVTRLENRLSDREAGIGAWSMVQPEDVRTVLSALRAAGEVQ